MEDISLPCSVIISHGSSQAINSQCHPEILNAQDSKQAGVEHVIQHAQLVQGGQVVLDSSNEHYKVCQLMTMWPDSAALVQAPQTTTLGSTVLNSVKVEHVDISSPRKRREKRPYSPGTVEKKSHTRSTSKKRIRSRRKEPVYDAMNADLGPGGEPFRCDKCKSPYIINPTKIRKSLSKKWRKPVARRKFDPKTNKLLILCNACGLAMDRPKKEKSKKVVPTEDEKTKYLEEAKAFARSLSKAIEDSDAERLYCPSFKTKPCRCLQNYIIGNGDGEDSRKRATHLLMLLKDAKMLSQVKPSQTLFSNTVLDKEVEKDPGIKDSNACKSSRRRCALFENMVLSKRQYLRDELHLCERACQRILLYSNNFLHKELKSGPRKGPRVARRNGKAILGLLRPIAELHKEKCCAEHCALMALTHPRLLETWRRTAASGQRQARRVLAEMLTPAGGARPNCYKFISMVSGCSLTTICSVNEHMKRTLGVRDPPEHGLKRWWRQHPRPKVLNKSHTGSSAANSSIKSDSECVPDALDLEEELTAETLNITIPSQEDLQAMSAQEAALQLQVQRRQLIELQSLVTKQRHFITQHIVQESEGIPHAQNMLHTGRNPANEMPAIITQTPSNAAPLHIQLPPFPTVAKDRNISQTPNGSMNGESTQHLVHIVEIPMADMQQPTVITTAGEQAQTISVLTSSGDLEPLTGSNFSNIYILPQDTAGGSSAVSFPSTVMAPGTEADSYSTAPHTYQSSSLVTACTQEDHTFQLYNALDSH